MDRKLLHDSNFQNELAKIAKQGNKQARNLLADGLGGFVISIAKKKAPSPTLIPDLVQEGYTALLGDAINSYDSSLGVNFRSYAVYWIISAMEKYLNVNLIGVPFKVPDNVGFDFRHNSSGVDWLKQQRFLTKIKDIEGELLDVFDYVPFVDEEYDRIFNEELLENFYKGIKNILTKGNIDEESLKRNTDIVIRYFCLGKYRNYPKVSITSLSEFYGISAQRISNIIKYAIQKLKGAHKRELLKYIA